MTGNISFLARPQGNPGRSDLIVKSSWPASTAVLETHALRQTKPEGRVHDCKAVEEDSQMINV